MISATFIDHNGDVVYNLFQWDINQTLRLNLNQSKLAGNAEIHFCNKKSSSAKVVAATLDGNFASAKIPNTLLQEPYPILAYLYITNPDTSARTMAFVEVNVKERKKPDDYVYTNDADVIRLTELIKQVEAKLTELNNAKETITQAGNAQVTRVTTAGDTKVGQINTAGDSKLNAINTAGKSHLDTINSAGTSHLNAINTAGAKHLDDINTAGTTNTSAVNSEGVKQVKSVSDTATAQLNAITKAGTENINAVRAEGEKQLGAVNQAASGIIADRQQITQNKNDITTVKQNLKELESRKADAIVSTASGEIVNISDSDNEKLSNFKIFGKSTQNGVPTPTVPIPIVNIGDKGNVKVDICGKNIFDEIMENGTISYGENKADTSFYRSKNYIGVKPSESYTFSINGKVNGLVVDYYDENKGVINGNVVGNTMYDGKFTTPSNCRYVRFRSFQNDKSLFENSNNKCQIERGTVATSYEPYREPQSITLTTPNGLPAVKVTSGGNHIDSTEQQWITDEIDLTRGKYIQRIKQYAFDGTEAFYLHNSDRYYLDLKERFENEKTLGMVSIAPCVFKKTQFGGTGIYFEKLFPTLDEFKAYLVNENAKGSPVTAIMPLKTPIERNLSPAEVEACEKLHSNYPTTIISNDENTPMEVDYVADTKNYVLNRESVMQVQIAEIRQALVNAKIAGGGYNPNQG